jgi:hypothetical protein
MSILFCKGLFLANFSAEIAVFSLKIGIFIYEIYPRKTPKSVGDVLPG